jgi:hypothetical protein
MIPPRLIFQLSEVTEFALYDFASQSLQSKVCESIAHCSQQDEGTGLMACLYVKPTTFGIFFVEYGH